MKSSVLLEATHHAEERREAGREVIDLARHAACVRVCMCVSAVSRGGARGGWWEASLDGRVDASEVWTTVLHARHGRPCAAGTAIHAEPTVTTCTCTCTCSGTSRPDRPPCEPHVCPHCLPFPALALSTRSHTHCSLPAVAHTAPADPSLGRQHQSSRVLTSPPTAARPAPCS